MSPDEKHLLLQDLKQMLDQCDTVFAEITNQEHRNIVNLRSAFQMMANMGYTVDEAKDEFTRFQAQFNTDRNQDQQPSQQCVEGSYSKPKYKHGMNGTQRYNQTFTLCLLVIPMLFFVGLVSEIWFYFNPWGRAFLTVRYVKAVFYIGVWYSMMRAFLPRFVANAFTTFFMFAGLGMVLSCEPIIDTWGIQLFGSAWIPFWVKTQWCYWGLLAITYLWAWWKLAHGPRRWILKYGVD
ncbi:hypothetical protein ACFL6U_24190 [Planctomycetota bacterium]